MASRTQAQSGQPQVAAHGARAIIGVTRGGVVAPVATSDWGASAKTDPSGATGAPAAVPSPNQTKPAVLSHDAMRDRIIESLENQGFTREDGRLIAPAFVDKADIRRRNVPAVHLSQSRAEDGLLRHQDDLITSFARGSEVEVDRFVPKLALVRPDSRDELLFRFTRLQWSIPTSAGYGRRLRFLVLDASNDKLVGIIGLGDPVFAVSARDRWIGWSREQSRANLHNVMDAFVLGAVPPYSQLLAGKLVALLVCADEVRAAFSKRYGHRSSVIQQRDLRSRLLMVTTTSALGRSSLYNRLRLGDRLAFESVGFTKGSGEFHFSNGVYADIRRFAEANCDPTAKQQSWGGGFRSRREVIRKALVALGLSGDWLYHGLEREVFVVPLATNAQTLLRGEGQNARWHHSSVAEIGEWYRQRWMQSRAQRDDSYLSFDPSVMRLWPTGTTRSKNGSNGR